MNPFALITDPVSGRIGLDPGISFGFARRMIAAQRRIKPGAELAIIQTATTASHSMQRAVQCKSAQGITTYGVPHEKSLKGGDRVLVDLGGSLHGYYSDITHPDVFGMMADQQRHLWFCECRSHLAGFAAARFDDPCAVADAARGGLMALAPVMPCPAFRTAPATGLRFGQSLRRNSVS